MRRIVTLICLLAGVVVMAPVASARVSGCGPAAPPLRPGQYEENNFYKVTAYRTSCHTARRVALAWLRKPHRHVDGFTCHEYSIAQGGPLMICKRGRAVIDGYNDGD